VGQFTIAANKVNRKRVYRLYREAGLAVRRRKRKRIGVLERKPLPKPTAANVSWSMDFVADGLIGGRRLRCLTIVDDCTRECLAIEVDTSLPGLRVQAVLERLADTRGLPQSITVDNVLNASQHFLRGNSDPGRAARANRRCETGQYTNYPVFFRGRAGEPCLTIVDTRFIATSA
jgi:transposase InsO family protein